MFSHDIIHKTSASLLTKTVTNDPNHSISLATQHINDFSFHLICFPILILLQTAKKATIKSSNLILIEDHIGDAIDNRILSLTVGADELSLDDMGLHYQTTTSRMILCNFRRFYSFSIYSALKSLGKLVSPISVTVLCRANQSNFLTNFLIFSRLKSLER